MFVSAGPCGGLSGAQARCCREGASESRRHAQSLWYVVGSGTFSLPYGGNEHIEVAFECLALGNGMPFKLCSDVHQGSP